MARTKQYLHSDFRGGKVDTLLARDREENEFKELLNYRIKDNRLQKIQGREIVTLGATEDPTTIIVPPRKFPLLSVNSLNKELAFSYNGNDYDGTGAYPLAALPERDYYTYDELARALRQALNEAVGSNVFSKVEHNVSYANKFEIEITDGFTLMIYWSHELTTLPKEIFGFMQSKRGTVAGFYVTVISDYEVWRIPPRNLMLATEDGLYDINNSEITYPDGSSIEASPEIYDAKWGNAFCDIANGRVCGVVRDQYFRKHPDESKIGGAGAGVLNAGDFGIYDNIPPGASGLGVAARFAYRNIKVRLASLDSTSLSAFLLNQVEHTFAIDTNGLDAWKLRIFYEDEEYGISEQLKFIIDGEQIDYLLEKDITNTGAGTPVEDVKQSIIVSPSIPVFGASGTSQGYLRFELDTDVDLSFVSLYFFHKASANAEPYLYTDGDTGVYAVAGAGYDFRFFAGTDELAADSGEYLYKASFVNKNGFETVLSDVLGVIAFSGANGYIDFRVNLPDLKLYDVDKINIYRTEAGGTQFYLLTSLPVVQALACIESFAGDHVILYDGKPDSSLIYSQKEKYTTRSATIKYNKSCWFDNRVFKWGISESPHVLYYSGPAGSEGIESVDTYAFIPIGKDGLKIIGAAGAGSKLVVFKESSLHRVDPIGDGYRATDRITNGCGTKSPYSIVAVGENVFYQGPNGHIYYYNGLESSNLTSRKLKEFVKTLNMSALDKTVGCWIPRQNEIIWSMCTGSSDTPNASVVMMLDYPGLPIYSTDHVSRHWVVDQNNRDVLGISENDIFRYDSEVFDPLQGGQVSYSNLLEATWDLAGSYPSELLFQDGELNVDKVHAGTETVAREQPGRTNDIGATYFIVEVDFDFLEWPVNVASMNAYVYFTLQVVDGVGDLGLGSIEARIRKQEANDAETVVWAFRDLGGAPSSLATVVSNNILKKLRIIRQKSTGHVCVWADGVEIMDITHDAFKGSSFALIQFDFYLAGTFTGRFRPVIRKFTVVGV